MNTDSGWPAALRLAAAIALLLLALTSLTTLWDRDEPRFAQAAVEMRASGDYLVPTFNGEVRPQKPPLIYWLMTLSLGVFGQREIAVRFWSPIGLAIAALATYAIGRRVASPRVGLLAMIVLVATPLTLVEGVAATTDAMLLGLMTSSIAIGVEWLFRPPRWWHVAAMGALLGLGALAKGPVAIGLPSAVLATTVFLVRGDVAWRGRVVGALCGAAVVGSAIFAAWYVPAASQDLAIGDRGPIDETLARVIEIREGHGTALLVAPFYYAAVIAIGFAPWTGRLLRAVSAGVRARDRSMSTVLLAVWSILPILAFTVAATKLPHYILPVWPALALVVARTFATEGARAGQQTQRVVRYASLAGAVLLAAGVVGGRIVERYKPAASVARVVRTTAVEGPLFVYEFAEPSLVFYSGRRLIEIPNEAALVEWSQGARSGDSRGAARRDRPHRAFLRSARLARDRGTARVELCERQTAGVGCLRPRERSIIRHAPRGQHLSVPGTTRARGPHPSDGGRGQHGCARRGRLHRSVCHRRGRRPHRRSHAHHRVGARCRAGRNRT